MYVRHTCGPHPIVPYIRLMTGTTREGERVVNPGERAFDAPIPAPTPGSMSKPPLLAVAFRLEGN